MITVRVYFASQFRCYMCITVHLSGVGKLKGIMLALKVTPEVSRGSLLLSLVVLPLAKQRGFVLTLRGGGGDSNR